MEGAGPEPERTPLQFPEQGQGSERTGKEEVYPGNVGGITGKEVVTMAYFNTCPLCGANLDPGEKCDCREKEKTLDMPKTYQGQAIKAMSSN